MNAIYKVIYNASTQTFQAVSEIGKSHQSHSQKSQPQTPARLIGAVLKLATRGSSLLALSITLLLAQTANAAPTGGQVVAGVADINQTALTTNINQTSQNAAINWQNFGIAHNETVNFNQPNTQAVTLNRVLGHETSVIDGAMRANGKVFITNPNGVLIGKDAQINVGSLLATTAHISNDDLMAGRYRFDNANAGIINALRDGTGKIVQLGQISVPKGGSVALIAPIVDNQGTITATEGNVLLASANKFSVKLDGERLGYTLDKGVLQGLVDNGGMIIADGGAVVLTSLGLDTIKKSVIKHHGIITANTVVNKGGRIELLGDLDNSRLELSGTITAEAKDGNGGFIETSAAQLAIKDTAHVSTHSTDGKTGTWVIDPQDFTVAPTGGDMTGQQVTTALNSNNVTLKSIDGKTQGNGDVIINDTITWDKNTLTLNAQNDIHINKTITGTGTAKLALDYYTEYYLKDGAKINLPAGKNFATKKHGDGEVIEFDVIHQMPTITKNSSGDWESKFTTRNIALGADIDVSHTKNYEGFAGWQLPKDGGDEWGRVHGLGHTVDNLTLRGKKDEQFTGLFQRNNNINDSIIRNIGVTNVNIRTEGKRVNTGGLLGFGYNIHNSYSTGNVSHTGINSLVGGLAGVGNNIRNSYTTNNVSTTGEYSDAGGLAGTGYNIHNSYAIGSVSTIERTSDAGGLVGKGGSIHNSYATGNVSTTGEYSHAGGLAGTGDNIYNSYAIGSVSTQGNYASTGGLVGKGNNIHNNYANNDNITAMGEICDGGFCGSGSGVGGLIGYYDYIRGSSSNSFFNTSKHPTLSAIGKYRNNVDKSKITNVTGKTDAELKQQSTFKDWDFDKVWYITEGVDYPRLQALATTITIAPTPQPDPVQPTQPDPVPAQPDPVPAQPDPVPAQPDPVPAQPDPVQPTQPDPVPAQPDPVPAQPDPVPTQPDPVPTQPDPVQPTQPDPVPVQPEQQKPEIKPSNTIIAANDLSKTYDGKAVQTVDDLKAIAKSNGYDDIVTISGLKDGDSISDSSIFTGTLDYAGDWKGAKDVKTDNNGKYTIIPFGLSGGQKYRIVFQEGSLKIEKALLSVIGNGVYTGTKKHIIQGFSKDSSEIGKANLIGIIGDDNVAIQIGKSIKDSGIVTLQGKDVGTHSITEFSNVKLTGDSAKNYELTPKGSEWVVTKKDLNIIAMNNIKPAGQKNPPLANIGIIIDGLVKGEEISDVAISYSDNNRDKDAQGQFTFIKVGQETFANGKGKASNYNIKKHDGRLLIVQEHYNLNEKFTDPAKHKQTILDYNDRLSAIKDEMLLAKAVYGSDNAKKGDKERFYEIWKATDKDNNVVAYEERPLNITLTDTKNKDSNGKTYTKLFELVDHYDYSAGTVYLVDKHKLLPGGEKYLTQKEYDDLVTSKEYFELEYTFRDGLYPTDKVRKDHPEMTTNYNGLNVGIYRNTENDKHYIVFRGTDTTGSVEACGGNKDCAGETDTNNNDNATDTIIYDGYADSDGGTNTEQVFGKLPPQYKKAKELVQEITNKHPNDSWTIVGHSLGGGLASYASIHQDKKIPTITFNQAQIHANNLPEPYKAYWLKIYKDELNKQSWYDKNLAPALASSKSASVASLATVSKMRDKFTNIGSYVFDDDAVQYGRTAYTMYPSGIFKIDLLANGSDTKDHAMDHVIKTQRLAEIMAENYQHQDSHPNATYLRQHQWYKPVKPAKETDKTNTAGSQKTPPPKVTESKVESPKPDQTKPSNSKPSLSDQQIANNGASTPTQAPNTQAPNKGGSSAVSTNTTPSTPPPAVLDTIGSVADQRKQSIAKFEEYQKQLPKPQSYQRPIYVTAYNGGITNVNDKIFVIRNNKKMEYHMGRSDTSFNQMKFVVMPNDFIKTENNKATITFPDGSWVVLDKHTTIIVKKVSDDDKRTYADNIVKLSGNILEKGI